MAPATVTIHPPVRVEPAYDDRDAVWRSVRSHAPFPLMAAGKGYGELIGEQALNPWFRSMWASDGVAVDDEMQRLLEHEPFVRGARELYGAQVVRPTHLILNAMGPMNDGGVHVDTPTYRGLQRAVAPLWLLVVMGMSGLFDRWAVRVAGALTWFYDGTDGEFEYWPRGLDEPSETVRGPFGNIALVADNDLMYHHVLPIGDADAFNSKVTLSLESKLHATGDDRWEIRNGDATIAELGPESVRISILWKALTFADAAAAAVYDNHDDDLDLETVVDIFANDLRERGVAFTMPSDPRSDREWAKTLTSTYMRRAG